VPSKVHSLLRCSRKFIAVAGGEGHWKFMAATAGPPDIPGNYFLKSVLYFFFYNYFMKNVLFF